MHLVFQQSEQRLGRGTSGSLWILLDHKASELLDHLYRGLRKVP